MKKPALILTSSLVLIYTVISGFNYRRSNIGNSTNSNSKHAANHISAPPPATQIYVRKNIYSLNPGGLEIQHLRHGVSVMQGRAATDPRSWSYQAAIHGSYDRNVKPNWNTCQHGSFFFFAWHRMYLYYFERILRNASGDNNLSLPYWNYSDVRAQSAMPVAFRVPANATNPLYTSQRDPDINLGAQLSPSTVSYQVAFTNTVFATNSTFDTGFGGNIVNAAVHFRRPHGQLENQPHDQVHGQIGGWMGDPNTAAQDPIFWLHHSNIDRLWEKWLRQGGGRANPTSNAVWMNTTFTFYNENGVAVNLKGSQILDIVRQLDYRYDDMPSNLLALEKLQSAALAPDTVKHRIMSKTDYLKASNVTTKGERTDVMVGNTKTNKLNAFIDLAVKSPLHSNPTGRQKVLLLFDGVTYSKMPKGVFEVYINLPKGTPPVFNSDYYAGNIGLFGFMSGHPGEKMNMDEGGQVVLDITGTIKKLVAKKIDVSNINVTIVHAGVILPKGITQHSTISGEIKIKAITVYGLQ